MLHLTIFPSARFHVRSEPSCERASAFVSPDMRRRSATATEFGGTEHAKAWPPS